MLIESLILAACGAGGGVLLVGSLGKWFDGWFTANESEFSQIPFWMHIRIDGRLLLALVGLTLLTNVLAGLWPAIQATKRDVNQLLKAQAGGTPGLRTGKFQRLLVMVQIAFSVVILTQALVLLSFGQRLKQVNLPFDPTAILTGRVDVPPSADANCFFDQLERNLTRLPGVQALALSTSDPVSGHGQKPIAIEGIAYPRPEDQPHAGSEVASAGFFRALNIRLLQGRAFTADDVAGSMPVAIVNSTFARLFLPTGNPLGHRFREGTNAWLTVVGCGIWIFA